MSEENPAPQQYVMPQGESLTTDSSLKYQLDFEQLIQNVVHVLRCEEPVFDEENGVQWKTNEYAQPLINEKGITRIRTLLRAKLAGNLFRLSVLSEDNIDNISYQMAMNLRNTLHDNMEEFGIPDETAASTILHTIDDQVFALLSSAKDGAYLKFLRTIHHMQEQSVTQHVPQERKGMFKRWMGG